tara:strand:- start:133 stop:708 length:576 start_codon:yes stop_codon:yes gene_type:complete
MYNFKKTDEELIFQFQEGNIEAFNELVRRYKDKLLNYVYYYFNDLDTAEDIVQDTFVKLYTHKNSYKEVAKFSTWIYTIAGNLSKTELRKRKRRKTFSMSDYTNDDYDLIIKSKGVSPDEKHDIDENLQKLKQALKKISTDFKTVLILRDIQELSYETISNITSMPLGTVKSRINRARMKLYELIKEEGEN